MNYDADVIIKGIPVYLFIMLGKIRRDKSINIKKINTWYENIFLFSYSFSRNFTKCKKYITFFE